MPDNPISAQEALDMYLDFEKKHIPHGGESGLGDMGVYLNCKSCGVFETLRIDGVARSRALGLKREVARELMAEQRAG
jgi:hypothetical protein